MTTQRASAMPAAASRRLDERPEEPFYPAPLLGPAEDGALAPLTELYRRTFPCEGAILDLMSSRVSHLPPEACYCRVVGVGTDECALLENPFLDEWLVRDLNRDPRLPFADGEFDGAAMCVGVQYLTRAVEVLREVGRVLRPGAPLVIAFSSCCDAADAAPAWRMIDDEARMRLLDRYLAEAGNWRDLGCWHRCPQSGAPLHAIIARSRGAAA